MTARSKTLLVVMAHAGANEMVQALWPYYERAGCDILGIGRIGSVWPTSPRLIGFRDEGQDCYNDGTSQLTRFCTVLEFVLGRSDVSPYSDFCFIEWDTLMLKQLGEHPGCCLVAAKAGHGYPPFTGSAFYHCPWWIDAPTASVMRIYGNRMLAAGLTERGFLDRWLGLMVDLYGLPVADPGAYTKNSLDRPEYIAEARAAIKAGAYAIHGVKTIGQLEQLTDGL